MAISLKISVIAFTIILLSCADNRDPNTFTGYIEAELVFVSAPEPGWLIDTHVREGDRVEAGALLFELDNERESAMIEEAESRLHQAEAEMIDKTKGAREDEIAALEAQLAEAQAHLAVANNEMKRSASLLPQGLTSKTADDRAKEAYESAKAGVDTIQANIRVARLAARNDIIDSAAAGRDAAEAVLAQAQWHMKQRAISANVSGQVEEIFYRTGEYIRAGSPVIAILPEEAAKVRFFVGQERLSSLSPGDEVTVVTDGDESRNHSARITHISRSAEFTPPVIYSADSREKLVFLVEAHLQQATALRPGQPVDVVLR